MKANKIFVAKGGHPAKRLSSRSSRHHPGGSSAASASSDGSDASSYSSPEPSPRTVLPPPLQLLQQQQEPPPPPPIVEYGRVNDAATNYHYASDWVAPDDDEEVALPLFHPVEHTVTQEELEEEDTSVLSEQEPPRRRSRFEQEEVWNSTPTTTAPAIVGHWHHHRPGASPKQQQQQPTPREMDFPGTPAVTGEPADDNNYGLEVNNHSEYYYYGPDQEAIDQNLSPFPITAGIQQQHSVHEPAAAFAGNTPFPARRSESTKANHRRHDRNRIHRSSGHPPTQSTRPMPLQPTTVLRETQGNHDDDDDDAATETTDHTFDSADLFLQERLRRSLAAAPRGGHDGNAMDDGSVVSSLLDGLHRQRTTSQQRLFLLQQENKSLQHELLRKQQQQRVSRPPATKEQQTQDAIQRAPPQQRQPSEGVATASSAAVASGSHLPATQRPNHQESTPPDAGDRNKDEQVADPSPVPPAVAAATTTTTVKATGTTTTTSNTEATSPLEGTEAANSKWFEQIESLLSQTNNLLKLHDPNNDDTRETHHTGSQSEPNEKHVVECKDVACQTNGIEATTIGTQTEPTKASATTSTSTQTSPPREELRTTSLVETSTQTSSQDSEQHEERPLSVRFEAEKPASAPSTVDVAVQTMEVPTSLAEKDQQTLTQPLDETAAERNRHKDELSLMERQHQQAMEEMKKALEEDRESSQRALIEATVKRVSSATQQQLEQEASKRERLEQTVQELQESTVRPAQQEEQPELLSSERKQWEREMQELLSKIQSECNSLFEQGKRFSSRASPRSVADVPIVDTIDDEVIFRRLQEPSVGKDTNAAAPTFQPTERAETSATSSPDDVPPGSQTEAWFRPLSNQLEEIDAIIQSVVAGTEKYRSITK